LWAVCGIGLLIFRYQAFFSMGHLEPGNLFLPLKSERCSTLRNPKSSTVYDLVRKPASATWDAIRNLFSVTDKEDAWKSRLRVLVIEHLDVICKRYKATDKEDDGDNVVSQILSKVCSVRYCSHHSLSHVKRWGI
jgi:hypothetical protein